VKRRLKLDVEVPAAIAMHGLAVARDRTARAVRCLNADLHKLADGQERGYSAERFSVLSTELAILVLVRHKLERFIVSRSYQDGDGISESCLRTPT
jgi:hypothetical protein